MKDHGFARVLLLVLLVVSVFSALVFAASQFNSPSACSGQWSSCANAFADNANRATATATGSSSKTGIWSNYGFSIKDSAIINSVVVRADFFASKTNGFIDVKVSGNGGATYGPAHTVWGNTAEQTFSIDVTGDVAWTGSKLNNTNFVVNVTCFKSGSGQNPKCNLDWVPVNVSYTPFDFSLSANPSSASVAQARSIQTAVTVALLGGTSQNVALSQTGCPTGATCSFNASSGNPTYKSNFTVATSSSTPAGSYPINITGSGDGLIRTTTFTVNVTDSQPVASASANPTSGDAPLSVSFTGAVTGGDAPLTYFWDFKDGANSTGQNSQHTYTVAGTYNVSFTAIDFDSDLSTSNVIVTVNEPQPPQFDFAVTANPAGVSISQGANTGAVVTVSLLSGTSQTVTLSQSGCPMFAECLFNVTSGNPSFTSNFTVANTTCNYLAF